MEQGRGSRQPLLVNNQRHTLHALPHSTRTHTTTHNHNNTPPPPPHSTGPALRRRALQPPLPREPRRPGPAVLRRERRRRGAVRRGRRVRAVGGGARGPDAAVRARGWLFCVPVSVYFRVFVFFGAEQRGKACSRNTIAALTTPHPNANATPHPPPRTTQRARGAADRGGARAPARPHGRRVCARRAHARGAGAAERAFGCFLSVFL